MLCCAGLDEVVSFHTQCNEPPGILFVFLFDKSKFISNFRTQQQVYITWLVEGVHGSS